MKALTLTLTRTEAAALCGLTPSGFDGWVRRGIVPPPIMGTRRWSRVQLERALAGQSWVPPEVYEDAEDAFDKWERENKERDKHRPLHNLNQREARTLRVLAQRGTSNGRDIDGAGEATFRALVKIGLAEGTRDGWRVSAEGLAEVDRMQTWQNWHRR